jgi:hypothetical protein
MEEVRVLAVSLAHGGVGIVGAISRTSPLLAMPCEPTLAGSITFACTDPMVRAVGIEPTLCHRNWILSPTRLQFYGPSAATDDPVEQRRAGRASDF